MKTLWTAISVVAVANLLAIMGAVGYLAASDRLTIKRLEVIRDMLGETTAAAEARRAREEAEAREQADALLATLAHGPDASIGAPAGTPGVEPLASPELVARHVEATRLDRQRIERMRREIDDLTRTLRRERVAIDRGWDELERDRRVFESMRSQIEAIEGTEQFRRALSALTQLKADAARDLLAQLIAGVGADGLGSGDREDGIMRAVLYLNAMPDRQRARVLNTFIEDDPALAAELLERLRTKGLRPRDPERQGM